MLSTEDLGVKEAISFCGSGLCICLATDFDALVGREMDVFWDEGVVEGV